jgi:hypothetical protein
MTATKLAATLALGLLLAASPATNAAGIDCSLRFSMTGWSLFYKTSSGTGTVTCSNGESMRVRIEARGGGLSVGRSTIENGIGEFGGVRSIGEVLGGYLSAEAHAGANRAAKGQVVTKGTISLALSGTGRGWDVGIAFGSFHIKTAR